MKTITLFLGKSGAGKDYLMKQFLKDNIEALPIVSITTRPPRPNEINGKDYKFVSEDTFWSYKLTGQLIEFREYNTALGTWLYGTPLFVNNAFDEYVGVVDINGAIEIIKAYYRQDDIIINCIYVETNDEIRTKRAKARGGFNEQEWKRRLKTDDEDFSQKNLDRLNIELKAHNYSEIKIVNNNKE